ncbi:uncharacterized protein JCM6883_006093 [Sporobolomyces salmoneus]|uniref:uncharacterized protein n=1 Tax=Sporobolomyces salmoneus TaxID=183962 RepID=UPI00317DB649
MTRFPSSSRLRAFYLSITSSRLIYVLLVDTALTFVLFTFLYQRHFTSLTHSSTVVNLCRSLRTTSSTGIPLPLQSPCHESSALLNAPSTFIQRFLSITKEVVLGGGGETESISVKTERNWKVLKFVAMKMVGLGMIFGFFCRSNKATSISLPPTGSIRLGENEKEEFVMVVVGSESSSKPLIHVSPPAYSPTQSSPAPRIDDPEAKEEDEKENEEDEDDLPWILLALSLIGHLAVVLIDQGALDRISTLMYPFVMDRWIIVGSGLFLVGLLGIWREWSTRRRSSGEELSRLEEVTFVEKKKEMVVIEL